MSRSKIKSKMPGFPSQIVGTPQNGESPALHFLEKQRAGLRDRNRGRHQAAATNAQTKMATPRQRRDKLRRRDEGKNRSYGFLGGAGAGCEVAGACCFVGCEPAGACEAGCEVVGSVTGVVAGVVGGATGAGFGAGCETFCRIELPCPTALSVRSTIAMAQSMNMMAHQVVAFESTLAAPRGPKAVWLPAPPNAPARSAALPLWSKTTMISTRQFKMKKPASSQPANRKPRTITPTPMSSAIPHLTAVFVSIPTFYQEIKNPEPCGSAR